MGKLLNLLALPIVTSDYRQSEEQATGLNTVQSKGFQKLNTLTKQKMKKKNRNMQGKRNLDLSTVLNANREVIMYKQLLVKQSVDAQIFKRRAMSEELDGDYYADLLEWISDYIFLQNWKDEKLMTKIEEFRAYRHKQYEKLLTEQGKLRTLEVNIKGRKKIVEVY